jgi:hypothetical protein
VDGLSLALLGQISPWGLVAAFVWLVMTGRLVPRATLQRERELLQQRAEDWKTAHDMRAKTHEVQTEQLREILATVKALAPVRSP